MHYNRSSLLDAPTMPSRNKNRADQKRGLGASRTESDASGDSLQAYLHAISRFPQLTPEQEKEVGRSIRAGNRDALNRLVETNLRFVVSYAKRYRGYGLAFVDLIHEGNLGLIEAARRFDPERNVRFISYAVWWIRQAILNALSLQARPFRLPHKVTGKMHRLRFAEDRLAAELDHLPTEDEIAEATKLSRREIATLRAITGSEISLSTAIADDGSFMLEDTLEQESIPTVEEELIRESLAHQVRALLDGLDAREREVISLRFGLDGDEPRTLQEIGDRLQLTRERVRQIESRAKERLRRLKAADGLRGYLN
ncbi:MAG: RNA polymerase sigma factor RpoD/SigA [Vicinamibacteria bacterium]|nr:RNA polymerase sigma factor RpoD/SigA [Vicinamibacteria bacterium]